jgi:hypothetical protein
MIRLKTFWVPVFYLRAWKTNFIQWLNNYFSRTSPTTTDTDIRRHLKYGKEIVKLQGDAGTTINYPLQFLRHARAVLVIRGQTISVTPGLFIDFQVGLNETCRG